MLVATAHLPAVGESVNRGGEPTHNDLGYCSHATERRHLFWKGPERKAAGAEGGGRTAALMLVKLQPVKLAKASLRRAAIGPFDCDDSFTTSEMSSNATS